MGQNLFSVLFSSLKSKFAAIVSKLRMWLSWNYIRTRVIGGIRDFFTKLFNVKPKNKDDYFTIFGWMVSKRLVYLVLIVIGVLSIWYITVTTKMFTFGANGIPTYSYNSLMLRLAKGKVKIKAKSGYIAFEGDVKNGYCTGEGKLYSPEGAVLYSGTFEKNRYEGEGLQCFENNNPHYKGSFHDNLYEGQGVLYRTNGTREYEGEFFEGLKEGTGKLFDSAGNAIYEGSFSSDNIIYGELLDKTPKDVRSMYYGEQMLYEESSDSGTDIAVYMKDINALYQASSDGDAADDEAKVNNVTVLSDVYKTGKTEVRSIEALRSILGEPVYEGYSSVILPEAVAINILNEHRNVLNGSVKMEIDEAFTDDIIVKSIDSNYTVYIYSFNYGGLVYSFVCSEKNSGFAFYEIQSGE